MTSSDDEYEPVPKTVSNYHFVDENDEPISFAELPIQWCVGNSPEGNQKQISLLGTADNGLQKIYKQVTAWKFDLSDAKPEISVLTKENNWIKLQKPRKSFEAEIRTILITIHCLQFLKMNPKASGKSLWDYLDKVFSLYEVQPSKNDLVDHMPLISEAVKRDERLKTCQLLLTFLEKKPRKMKAFNEVMQPIAGFIDTDDTEDGSDKEAGKYDSVCAICDNGGDLLCCEGCMRSFHATRKAGAESACASLRLTDDQVQAMKDFYCKNCQRQQHQCFACGKLGSSNKSAGAEVFPCVSATCGHFYHPQCVAKRLHRENEVAAEELQEKIAAGESFTCPVHKCCVCKQGEYKKVPELQFAVCRRCPKAYHKKCLPRKIAFEDLKEEGIIPRAWEGLLPNRILIYCLKHEIDEEIGTPIRNHIKFPDIEERKKNRASDLPLDTKKGMLKRKRLASAESPRERGCMQAPRKVERLSSAVKKGSSLKGIKKVSSSDSLEKMIVKDASKKSSCDNNKTVLAKADESSARDEDKMINKESEHVKPKKQDMNDSDHEQVEIVRPAMKKLSSSSYQLNADSERRLLALMKESASSITLEQIKEKHQTPSTYAYSSRNVVDEVITQGKVDGAVEALRTALQKLEAGCSIEDAKAVCDPEVLNQLVKWKDKLKDYLAPFLHGMSYTSYGRHFTEVNKLEEIVEKLHWYVENGDTIVDFCCGTNDFSCLMERKLEGTGKKCFYKNYDIFTAKNDFNFEQRDWMEVQPKELPTGSQLIMGLNPPFEVHTSLANTFIDKALKFKPKLIILIVPQETERLDEKKTPYDMVWEDNELLLGKSFYLPGSIDENDKQMGQWNVEAPPLYLWSRPDWTAKHKAIALKHGHLPRLQSHHDAQIPDHPLKDHCGNGDDPILKDDHPVHNDGQEVLKRKTVVTEDHNNHSHEKDQSSEKSNKRRRANGQNINGMSEVSFRDRQCVGRTPIDEVHRETPIDEVHRETPLKAESMPRTKQFHSHDSSTKSISDLAGHDPGLGHMSSSGHDPLIGSGNGIYDTRSIYDPRRPPLRLGFAPGPHPSAFSHQSSSGWLDE